MSGEHVHELPIWNEVMAGNTSRWSNPKPEAKLHVSGLKVIEQFNDSFAAPVEHLS